MKKIAIDLTWVRHGKVGGTESSVTNLLKGLEQLHDEESEFYLSTRRITRSFFKNILYVDILNRLLVIQ